MVKYKYHINTFHTRNEVLTIFSLLITTNDEVLDISEVVFITHSLENGKSAKLENCFYKIMFTVLLLCPKNQILF